MTQIRTLAEAESVLLGYMPLAQKIIGKDITLERMWPLMAALGNPEKPLRVIHIAGTSGKTSTAYYIAALLTAAGKKTGLTVSPHMDTITERVQVNLSPLGEDEFCNQLNEFLAVVQSSNIEPTYFELLIAFVYWYFDKAGVDYAVIETGLGGLMDCTNVAKEQNKICVITDIGYDHVEVLGSEIKDIAAQKAGIIHEGNAVCMYGQDVEVMAAVEARVLEKQATWKRFTEDELRAQYGSETLNALPAYKQRNWLLARAAFQFVAKRDGLLVENQEIIKTLATYIPGRMDYAEVNGKTIIMDGAHNGQKMRALVHSFQKSYDGKKTAVLLAMKQSKDYKDALRELQPIVSQLIVTNFALNQDRASHGTDPVLLAVAARELGIETVIAESQDDGFMKLQNAAGDTPVIVTGSLYLLSQLRQNHKELRHA